MNVPARQNATAPPPKKRMLLQSVKTGLQEMPLRVLLFGTSGVGKSTWAAATPAPIFFCAEDGAANLDVARFPEPESWPDLFDAIDTLQTEAHPYKTFVIDTVDALEAMLWRFICERDKKKDISEYGYGKGFDVALVEWRLLLSALEKLQRATKINIVLLGHSHVKLFKNPEGEDYERYQLKLYDKHGAVLREWCEEVLFARYETFAVKEEGKRVAKGVSSGARVVHTETTAAWDAKNRHSLPEMLPLNYDDFAAAVLAHRPADPEKLKKSIAEKLAILADATLSGLVGTALDKAGDDAAELAKIDDRLKTRVNAAQGA